MNAAKTGTVHTRRPDHARRTSIRTGLAVVLSLVSGACESSPTAPGVSPEQLILETGSIVLESLQQDFSLTARVLDGEGREIPGVPLQWDIEAPGVIESIGGSSFRSVANGTTTLHVTIADHYPAMNGAGYSSGRLTAFVTVRVAQTPAGLVLGTGELSPTSVIPLWYLGQDVALTGWLVDALGNPIGEPVPDIWWESLDPAVSMVDAGGAAMAVGPGSGSVSGSAGGFTGSTEIEVDPHLDLATCVRVSGNENALACGESRITFAIEGY